MTIYRTLAKKYTPVLLLAGLSLTAVPGLAQSNPAANGPATAASAVAQASRESPRYLLMGTNGRAVRSEDFRERFQLIAFGFVSCPDVCPTTLLEMQQVLAALGDQAKHLQPIFITVDPERDTLEVLKAYTANFDKRILGLTGSAELVRFAANNFKVDYTKVQEPGAGSNVYTMDHTAGMFLIGPDGQLLKKFAYRTPAQTISAQIKTWIDETGRLELSKPKH
jgi:protein SCO1/2